MARKAMHLEEKTAHPKDQFEEAHGVDTLKRLLDIADPGCPYLDKSAMLTGAKVIMGALAEQLRRADELLDEVEVNARISVQRGKEAA